MPKSVALGVQGDAASILGLNNFRAVGLLEKITAVLRKVGSNGDFL